jgi:Fe-S-cluster containining protein
LLRRHGARNTSTMERNVEDVVRELYEFGDQILVEQIIRGGHVSCQKGCHHCCYLMATTSLLEAMLLARWVGAQDSKTYFLWVTKLLLAAREVAPVTNDGEWFDRQRPCPFLKDSLCQVYEIRPGCCRWHVVKSPVEQCSVEAGNGARILVYNTSCLDNEAVRLATVVHDGNPQFGKLGMGPIPLAVLWALRFMSCGKQQVELEEAMKGLPTLHEWSMLRWRRKGLRISKLPILK